MVEPKPYAGSGGAVNYAGSVAWYRTSFRAETAGVYALSFQSANYLAQVWVDGTELGSHSGSYLPFEFRRNVSAGVHTVVVRVDWRNPERQAREGFHRTWFNWGGLDGEATVRPIGLSELSQPRIQTTLPQQEPTAGPARVRDQRAGAQQRSEARTLTPTGVLSRGAEQIPLSFRPLSLEHGQTANDTASVTVAEPALWSTAHPNIYDLSLEVPGESSYVAHVGLRQLTWHGGHVYLNGQLLRLHGASVQADAVGHGDALTPVRRGPDRRRARADPRQRGPHPAPAGPGACSNGWTPPGSSCGRASGRSKGPATGTPRPPGCWPKPKARRGWRSAPRCCTRRSSPGTCPMRSPVTGATRPRSTTSSAPPAGCTPTTPRAWWPSTSGATTPRRGRPGRSTTTSTRSPRPTTAAGTTRPATPPPQLAALMRSRLAAMQRTFPGRVLVISEFGAESNDLNPGGAPGSYSFQARLLAEHISVYAADPSLTAMMIWLLRDYPLNPTFQGGSIKKKLPRLRLIEALSQKGLFTYGGLAKPAVSVVARMYQALGSAPARAASTRIAPSPLA